MEIRQKLFIFPQREAGGQNRKSFRIPFPEPYWGLRVKHKHKIYIVVNTDLTFFIKSTEAIPVRHIFHKINTLNWINRYKCDKK